MNPGLLPQADHAQHDRWLIARAASHDDDLTPAEASSARALMAGCNDCAALAADITTISHATAVSLAPMRPRDFRLTPEQAEQARGGVLDRLGRWVASPRATLLRPLAGASLAIGIMLVVVAPSVQGPLQAQVPAPAPNAAGGAPVASTSTGGAAETTSAMDMQVAPQGSAPANPEVQTQVAPEGSGAASAQMLTMAAPSDANDATRMAKATPDGTAGLAEAATPDPQLADVQPVAGASPDAGGVTQDTVAAEAPPMRASDDTSKALVLLGIVLAGTGLIVLLLTWWLRRDAGDPLLR